MSAEINYKGNLKIEEYEFGAFLQAFQDAVLNGYVLDLESNEHYPQRWGTSMEVTLVSTNFQPVEDQADSSAAISELLEKTLGKVEEITEVPAEGAEEVKPEEIPVVAKRGRKSSS